MSLVEFFSDPLDEAPTVSGLKSYETLKQSDYTIILYKVLSFYRSSSASVFYIGRKVNKGNKAKKGLRFFTTFKL